MNKTNTIIPLASLAAIGTLVPACKNAAEEDKIPTRPNIMLIIAEDMTIDLGCYGRTDVKTPNLDRLASEGVMYTNARAVSSVSSPTRSAMLTGLHQEITGSHNHRTNRDTPLPDPSIKPFTWYLRNAGYTCVLGDEDCFENKFTGNDFESTRKIDCNFKFENVGPYDGVEHFGIFDKVYNLNPDDVPFFSQVTLYMTHRGDWWKKTTANSMHPVDPAKVNLPDHFADHPKIREEFACYLDQVEYMDEQVGLLLHKLENKKLLDNTIIVFIADNGRADIRGKGYLYDEGTHIPMIVWGKGIKHAVVDDMVSELDLPASFLQLAGIEIPDYYQGKPLDLFNGDDAKNGGHEDLYIGRDTWDEIFECMRATQTEQYIYIRNYRQDIPYDPHHLYQDFYRPALHIMRTMRDEGKLNYAQMRVFSPKPYEELYDWTKDPFCINNLAEDPALAGVKADLSARMDAWQAQYPDKGIEDRYTRELLESRKEENRQRFFVKKFHPDEWAKIEAGEICDKYDYWKIEMKKTKAAAKKLGIDITKDNY